MVDAPRAVQSVRVEARPDRGWSGRCDSGRPQARDIGRYSSAVSRPRGDDTRKHSDPEWHTAYKGTARRGARGDRRRERYRLPPHMEPAASRQRSNSWQDRGGMPEGRNTPADYLYA